MSRFRWYGPTLVLLVTTLGLMFATPALIRSVTWAGTNATITTIRNDLDSNPSLVDLSDAFKQVARAVEPSVVHVEIQSRRSQRRTMDWTPRSELDPRIPDEFREFFDRFGDPRAPNPEDDLTPTHPEPQDYSEYDSYRPVGNGSGWVYRHDGDDHAGNYVITNAHVVREVEDTERIKLTFEDRREVYATVVGLDEQTDVAVLEVDDADYLHPAALASDMVEQGEIVFAFGSPFGASFSFSMSQGIVSAVGRRVGIIGDGQGYENFIQTDAAINPGNSGGPLVNTRGQVVGMNTAIASRTGTYNGIGFAIPVSLAANIADRIITDGEVKRGFLGVEITEIDPDTAAAFGFEGDGGVLIQDLIPGGAAADAGVEPGDIITGVDGEPVASVRELRFRVADLPPGRDVTLKLFRDGKTVERDVKLGNQSELLADGSQRLRPRRDRDGQTLQDEDRLLRIGITGAEAFSESLARRIGVEHVPGVLITDVRERSAAAGPTARLNRARVVVVTHVFDQPVTSVSEFVEAVNASDPDQPLRLTVKYWDGRAERFRQFFAVISLN